jgi:hypothetical protein
MGQPIADEKPYATFVFNHEGEEYVLRSDYERLRALVPDSRDTLRAQWNAMHGVGRWIPVSERLPAHDTRVLVAAKQRDGEVVVKEMLFVDWSLPPEPPAPAWSDDYGGEEFDSVTHWQPLPEPPTN